MQRFRHESRFPVPPPDVFAWHERPGAFERLVPPWATVHVRGRRGTIRDGDEVVMELRKGPLHLTWHLRHRDFVDGEAFTDEQLEGPFQRWVHTHRFRSDGESGTTLIDDTRESRPRPRSWTRGRHRSSSAS